MSKPGNGFALPVNGAKKRILLVDSFPTRRDLRARVMRKLGIEVDCAADISEARSLWRVDSYDLVLMNVRNEPDNVDAFCVEVRAAKPPQALAFLVGKPGYLAAVLDPNIPVVDDPNGEGPWAAMVEKLFADSCELLPNRWGIKEASWRIRAARSLKDPRSNGRSANARVPSWADAITRHSKDLSN